MSRIKQCSHMGRQRRVRQFFFFHLLSGGTPGSQVAERRKLGDRSKAVNTEFCFITFCFVLLLNSALMFLRGKIKLSLL